MRRFIDIRIPKISALRWLLLWIPGLLLWTGNSFAQGETGNARIQNFRPSDYRAHGQNFAALQDQRGLLYVGNVAGVLEYDGTNWRLIPTAKGSIVRSLAKGMDGRIYVGARSEIGYLNVNPSGILEFVGLEDQLPAGSQQFGDVWQTYATAQGVFYVAGQQIFHYHQQTLQSIPTEAPIVSSFLFQDEVWIQLEGKGLFKIANKALQAVAVSTIADDGTELTVKAILPKINQHTLVVTHRNGLFHLTEGALLPLDWPVNLLLQTGFANNAVRLPDGNIAVASEHLGVITFSTDGAVQFLGNKGTGLQDQTVYGLFVDAQQGLWTLLNQGIARIELQSPISLFNAIQGLEGGVNDVQRFNDQLYVATRQGLFRLDQNQLSEGLNKKSKPMLRSFVPIPGIDLACYQLETIDKQLYIASAGGVFLWNGSDLRQLRSEYTFCIAKQGDHFYTGSLDSVREFKPSGSQWQQERSFSTRDSEALKILALATGEVLVQTATQGLWRLRNHQLEALDVGSVLTQNQLVEYQDKTYVLNNQGAFEYLPSKGKFESTDRFLLAPEQDWLGLMVESSTGSYFTVDGKGTGLALASENHEEQKFNSSAIPFSAWSGFLVQTLWSEAGGVTWLGGPEGLLRYDENIPKEYPKDFSCLLRTIRLQGDSVLFQGNHVDSNGIPIDQLQFKENTVFPFGINTINFAFAAMDPDHASPIKYEYFLEGFDSDWSLATAENVKEYTNLDYGTYTFHVKAFNGYGFPSEESTFSFTITTPWYAQWWAYLVYLAAFLGLTMFIVRIRSQRLEKEKRELEKMVAERTSEIQEQKEEILSQSDTLYIKNQELEKINQMVGSINTGISFSAVMGHIIDEIRFIRDVERAVSLVLDEKKKSFVVRSSHGWDEDIASKLELSEEAAEALLLQRSAKVGDDLYYVAEGYQVGMMEHYPEFKTAQTSLILIIRVEEQTRGYLVLECLSKSGAFGPQDFDLMSSFKEHVVSAFIKSKIMNELQQTFDNLRETQAKLVSQEKMAGLGQLTAGIAHEINNPINFISGNVKPLRRDLADLKEVLEKYAEIEADSDVEDLLEEIAELKEDIDYDFVLNEIDSLISDIENGASRTAEIVKDLRNFSRLDEASWKKASIEDGLDSTLSILKNKYKERVEIIRDYAPLQPIDCNAGKLNQVFMNILNNAVQAIPGKGSITLKTIDKGDDVFISIKDTGSGMTDETKQKLFDPFYTTKDVGEGTGLGMSISFGVIKDHHGTIEFNSELGVGTEFVITLPKQQAAKKDE